jgi:hypothetical protein
MHLHRPINLEQNIVQQEIIVFHGDVKVVEMPDLPHIL